MLYSAKAKQRESNLLKDSIIIRVVISGTTKRLFFQIKNLFLYCLKLILDVISSPMSILVNIVQGILLTSLIFRTRLLM